MARELTCTKIGSGSHGDPVNHTIPAMADEPSEGPAIFNWWRCVRGTSTGFSSE